MAESPKATILIVEDDALFQSVYCTRLEEEGYNVKVAGNGEEALQEMEAAPPDLILLDIILPRLSGFEVLERLRADARFAQIPVIILSNRSEPKDIERGLGAGANDYLVKTTTHPKEVFRKIRQHLAKEGEGNAPGLRVALRDGALDIALVAKSAGKASDLRCKKCKTHLVLELYPKSDRPGWFEAQLVCPQCEN
jgi:DNA-binding response OmpR family regulator